MCIYIYIFTCISIHINIYIYIYIIYVYIDKCVIYNKLAKMLHLLSCYLKP